MELLESPEQLSFELIGNGGLAPLCQVIQFVRSNFGKEVGTDIISRLAPETVCMKDFLAFLICQILHEESKAPIDIVLSLNKGKAELITGSDVAVLCHQKFDVWVS